MENRILRARTAALESSRDRRRSGKAEGTCRLPVQVAPSTSMPSGELKTYLCNVVTGFDFDDVQGATATANVETSQTIPVVFLGSTPAPGEQYVAHAVGGRWVAERRGESTPTPTPPPPSVTCCPCSVPKTNLTLAISGGPSPGNATLVFNPTNNTWISACVNGVVYAFVCGGLTATVFTDTANCNPAGGSAECESEGLQSRNIPLTAFNCSPFSFTFEVTENGCPFLSELGYTGFTVTGPVATICQCTQQILPNVFLTDAVGTHDLTSGSLLSLATPPVSPVADPNEGCNGTPGTGTTCVSYFVQCSAGPTPDKLTMTVTRQWVTCGCTGGQQYQSGPGVGGAQCPGGECIPGGTGQSIGSAEISGTPWSVSITLTQSGTSTLPDPMGDAPIMLSS
jgi:hypothetical protein